MDRVFPYTPADWHEMEERGRRMAALQVASDLTTKARVEIAFGVEFCRQRWPEAYPKEN